MEKSRFSLIGVFLALFLTVSFLTRAALTAFAWPELEHGLRLLIKIFSVGLFFDLLVFSCAAAPFGLWVLFAPSGACSSRRRGYAVRAAFFLCAYALAFIAASEYLFFYEFGVRFNFIAVDYLVYTNEVWGNIRESYNLAFILPALFVFSAAALALAWKPLDRALAASAPPDKKPLLAAALLAAPALGLAFVTLDWARISGNEYANELASNGVYSFFSALRNNELPYDKFYASLDAGEAFGLVRADLAGPGVRFSGPGPLDIKRWVTASGPEKKLNIVLIVEESLSGEYLRILGGTRGLTPNLDALAPRSLFFRKFYATGTRTVRGLEALNLSAPPLPGTSIVKRPDSAGFFSWGALMRGRGYDNKYIYAGYGYFDNMNSFFSGNGFDIVDRADFAEDEIAFANVWGVSDEDLLDRTIKEADKSHKAGKPFFSLVMTTSNHRPFTYPEGRIDIPPSSRSRRGAVKYADYAIGKFLKDAESRPWFGDTVFIITADHCANSADRAEMPVPNYHIPLLIYSPAHVKPGLVDGLAGQADLAPTVLGLLNFSYESRFLGRDALKAGASAGRAFVSTYQKLGFLKGDLLAVLGPKKYASVYRVQGRAEIPYAGPEAAGLTNGAIAYYQSAGYLCKNRLNRIGY